MTTTLKVVLIILAVGALLFLCYGFCPMKYAVKESNITTSEDKIFCKIVRTTGFEWELLLEEDGEVKTQYIKLEGESPFKELGFSVEYGGNVFIFYGKYIGEDVFDGIKHKIFKYDKWEILYPVKRNSLFNFLLPKSYLSRYDMQ